MKQTSVNSKALYSLLILLILSFHCQAQKKALFDTGEILEISMKGDFDKLFKDTKGEPQYFDFSLSYVDNSQKQSEIPLK
jgi:hypothetical protein